MLIEIIDSDSGKNGNGHFCTGDVVAQDGEEVARWYYFCREEIVEIWFEPDKDFIDLLTTAEIQFLEKMIIREVTEYEKDQAEFDTICAGV